MKNIIITNIKVYTFSIILKINNRFFSIYLVVNKIKKIAFKVKIKKLNSIEGLKSLLQSLYKKIDLETVKLGKFNLKLKP